MHIEMLGLYWLVKIKVTTLEQSTAEESTEQQQQQQLHSQFRLNSFWEARPHAASVL